jgi:hypothetical protein
MRLRTVLPGRGQILLLLRGNAGQVVAGRSLRGSAPTLHVLIYTDNVLVTRLCRFAVTQAPRGACAKVHGGSKSPAPLLPAMAIDKRRERCVLTGADQSGSTSMALKRGCWGMTTDDPPPPPPRLHRGSDGIGAWRHMLRAGLGAAAERRQAAACARYTVRPLQLPCLSPASPMTLSARSAGDPPSHGHYPKVGAWPQLRSPAVRYCAMPRRAPRHGRLCRGPHRQAPGVHGRDVQAGRRHVELTCMLTLRQDDGLPRSVLEYVLRSRSFRVYSTHIVVNILGLLFHNTMCIALG